MITATFDPGCDAELHQFLRAATDPRSGTLSLRSHIGGSRDTWLYNDTLRGLGKTYQHSSLTGYSSAAAYSIAWLVAEGIDRVVLYDASCASPKDLVAYAQLATAYGIDLHIVSDGVTPDALRKHLQRLDPVPLAAEALVAIIDGARQPSAPPPGRADLLAEVPIVDPLHFRATCRHLLSAEEFGPVDAVYRGAFAEAVHIDFTLGEELVAHAIYALLADSDDPSSHIITVKAVQAAAFRAGWHVAVDLNRMLGHIGPMTMRRHLDDEKWALLYSAVRPSSTALAGLAAAGAEPSRLHLLTGDNVASDGSEAIVDGQHLEIPAAAHKALRAQHVARELFGRTPTDAFLDDSGRLGKRSASPRLNDMARAFSIPIHARFQETVREVRWQQRWGLSIERILQ